jgi:hypothetical protein
MVGAEKAVDLKFVESCVGRCIVSRSAKLLLVHKDRDEGTGIFDDQTKFQNDYSGHIDGGVDIRVLKSFSRKNFRLHREKKKQVVFSTLYLCLQPFWQIRRKHGTSAFNQRFFISAFSFSASFCTPGMYN